MLVSYVFHVTLSSITNTPGYSAQGHCHTSSISSPTVLFIDFLAISLCNQQPIIQYFYATQQLCHSVLRHGVRPAAGAKAGQIHAALRKNPAGGVRPLCPVDGGGRHECRGVAPHAQQGASGRFVQLHNTQFGVYCAFMT